MTSDATFLNGEVVALEPDKRSGAPIAVLKLVITTQDGDVMATGQAEVQLPTP